MPANLTPSAINLVILAEVTAGWCPKSWLLTSGKAITYEVATSENVYDVKWNGTTPLVSRSTINDVEANPGSYTFISGVVYVSAPTGQTPFTGTVTVVLLYHFSNKARIYNDTWYDPRVLSVPSLSLRIESRFGGVGQVGGGDLKLANADGYFDTRSAMQWDFGTVTIKVLGDTRYSTASYASGLSTIGTWAVEDWQQNDKDFTLKLREIKHRLNKSIPLEFYGDGKTPKQLAWGYIYGVKPVEIGPLTYQVAGHAIFGFLSLRALVDEYWKEIHFATIDASTAQFTIDAIYESSELSVSFVGKSNGDGTPMLNGVRIIEDILATIGETNINTLSFTEGKARLKLGTDIYGREVSVRNPSVYVSKVTDALKVISSINETLGSYLYSDATGQYYVGVYEPQQGESLTDYSENQILQDTLMDKDDNKDLTSKVVAGYANYEVEEAQQVYEVEVTDYQHCHGQPARMVKAITIMLSSLPDAKFWAQRRVYQYGRAIRTRSIVIPWIGFAIQPGTHVRITYTRRGSDDVMEVLESKTDFMTGKVSLVLGDCRTYQDKPGFWVANADVLPTRFASHVGYGAGSLVWNASWSSEIKTWARQNVGYWENANGFAGATDTRSHLASIWT